MSTIKEVDISNATSIHILNTSYLLAYIDELKKLIYLPIIKKLNYNLY